MISRTTTHSLFNKAITSLVLTFFIPVMTQDQHGILLEKILSQDQGKQNKRQRIKNARAKKMNFVFENEGIIDVVNTIAAHKEINILLPVKDTDFEKIKINFDSVTDVTVDQAWNFLQILLELSGYAMIREEDLWKIVKKDKTMNREPLPLFVGIRPDELPESEDRVRYIYFFSNLRVGDNANKLDNEITALMNILLADQSKFDASHYLDQATNAIILAGKSTDIKAAMKVITYLDTSEIQEVMEVVKLNYLSADFVTNLLQNLQDPSESEKKQNPLIAKSSGATYFSRNVKIIPFGSKNSLILLGKQADISRIRDFTQKYLDVPLESGQSVLHIYKLQYLDADEFAKVLKKIVERDPARKTTGQASGKTLTDSGDIEAYFDEGILIYSDKPNKDEIIVAQNQSQTKSDLQSFRSYNTKSDDAFGNNGGGNKLVIACRASDWEKIRKLIEDLDTPAPQVVIEVLITEMQAIQVREIASQLRNPACFPMPSNVNAQTGMADASGLASRIVPGYTPGQTPVIPPNSLTTIQSDLLANAFPAGGGNFQNLATGAPVGGTIIQINDPNGKTWGLLEILDTLNAVNIVSNPHVIATNNTKTIITAVDQRLLPDTSANTGGQGTTTIKRAWADAPVQVVVTPRISGDFVNLNLEIDITRFLTGAVTNNPAQQSRLKRQIYTQANVPNGSILALGGLTSNADDALNARTPILGRIPILGYFFKRRSNTENDATLVVFICPTIIQPRLRAGVSDYTNEHINLSKKYIEDGMAFTALRDPITHWFFSNEGLDQMREIDDFLVQDDMRAREFYKSLNAGTADFAKEEKKLAKKQTVGGVREIQSHEAAIDSALLNTTIDTQAAEDIEPITSDKEPAASTSRTATPGVKKTTEEKNVHNKKERPLRTLMTNLENPLKRRR